MRYGPGDTVTTRAGTAGKILAIEPNRGGGPDEHVYKIRFGREVWRIYTSTVDNYDKEDT